MNNIDILEEKEKEAIKDLEEYLHWEELQGFSMLPRDKHIETLLNLVETLIAENKELKEKLEIKKNTPEWEYQYWEARKEVNNEWKLKIKEQIEIMCNELETINKKQLYEEKKVQIYALQFLLGKE